MLILKWEYFSEGNSLRNSQRKNTIFQYWCTIYSSQIAPWNNYSYNNNYNIENNDNDDGSNVNILFYAYKYAITSYESA